MNKKSDIYKLVMTALMASIIFIMTFSIRVPVPATNGYIHLGDSMIFVAVIILGWKRGALAAGFGSALSDFVAGYNHYVPVTFIIKALMAIAMGILIERAISKGYSEVSCKVFQILGMVLGGIIMVSGYYFAESLMYGSFATPLAAIPMNLVQFVSGLVLAVAVVKMLEKSPVKNMMEYSLAK